MIYDCVMYVQTQYVDLYITENEHASPPLRPLYKDAVTERKEMWTRRFITEYILRKVTISDHFEI
jgi:hypothetical protein